MNPIPDYGDHMTSEEFHEAVKRGAFVDTDGIGQYATATMLLDELCRPSTFEAGKATHVVWFNK